MRDEMIDIPPAPTPIHLGMLLFAGAGSLEAQRAARDASLAVAGSEDAPIGEAITAAEMFGWMALRSGDPADFRCLAAILLRRADELSQRPCHRVFAFAQAINVLDLAADAGDSEAMTMLDEVLSRAPAEAIPDAKMLKVDWLQTVEQINAQFEGVA